MSDSYKHLKAFKEGIQRARLIRQDLRKTLTEYRPEKVRGLNNAYISTIKEVIKQGNLFLDKTDNFELGLKVAITMENYQAFLSTLPNADETK
jgi:hypothetical protein|tara:strand:+ start:143 stop:421 length:279 start_codon:yes stop_codon:yes gene_type:complete